MSHPTVFTQDTPPTSALAGDVWMRVIPGGWKVWICTSSTPQVWAPIGQPAPLPADQPTEDRC